MSLRQIAEKSMTEPTSKFALMELHTQYRELIGRFGDNLWRQLAGREFELSMEHDDLSVTFCERYVFACRKTITLYWDICDCIDFGYKHYLLIGQRGSGKEVLADLIAERTNKRVVKVNCASLVESIADALLFGIAPKSGIAGAAEDGNIGFVQSANKNVLFLDEIFDAPSSIFPKLLRLLQGSREFFPVGTSKPMALDPETVIVAASNRYETLDRLREAIKSNKVRADLVDRFDKCICLPPLVERKKEIPHIIRQVIAAASQSYTLGTSIVSMIPDSHWDTVRYHPYEWPGNIRELKTWLLEFLRHTRMMKDEALIIESIVLRLDCLISNNVPDELGTSKSENAIDYLVSELCRRSNEDKRKTVNRRWVADQCRIFLNLPGGNVSQKLKEKYDINATRIADLVNQRLRTYSNLSTK